MKIKIIFGIIILLITSCQSNEKTNVGDKNLNKKTDDDIVIPKPGRISKSRPMEKGEHYPKTFYDETIKVDSNNVPLSKNEKYFPLILFPEIDLVNNKSEKDDIEYKPNVVKNVYDTFVVKWYSDVLFAMREPLLFNKKMNKEIYRFTWLRSFHNPIVITIVNTQNQSFNLFWKEFEGEHRNGKNIVNKSKQISRLEWITFRLKLSKSHFWTMGAGRIPGGLDGSEWILEGADDTKYKVATVWSPKGGDYYKACMYLLSLTDLIIPENEIY